jgi:hypothetical protein
LTLLELGTTSLETVRDAANGSYNVEYRHFGTGGAKRLFLQF